MKSSKEKTNSVNDVGTLHHSTSCNGNKYINEINDFSITQCFIAGQAQLYTLTYVVSNRGDSTNILDQTRIITEVEVLKSANTNREKSLTISKQMYNQNNADF